ncbi:unannotated protein [freshwater metagenome]|uniref:Unannotated protein n=1 Tax=freshwater metagenome TaxID=449393 RepID=A0A6J7AUD2_9ZZZZ
MRSSTRTMWPRFQRRYNGCSPTTSSDPTLNSGPRYVPPSSRGTTRPMSRSPQCGPSRPARSTARRHRHSATRCLGWRTCRRCRPAPAVSPTTAPNCCRSWRSSTTSRWCWPMRIRRWSTSGSLSPLSSGSAPTTASSIGCCISSATPTSTSTCSGCSTRFPVSWCCTTSSCQASSPTSTARAHRPESGHVRCIARTATTQRTIWHRPRAAMRWCSPIRQTCACCKPPTV